MDYHHVDRLLRDHGFHPDNRARRAPLVYAILDLAGGVERVERAIHKYAQTKGLKPGEPMEIPTAWLKSQTGLSWRQIHTHLKALDGNGYQVQFRRAHIPVITILATEVGFRMAPVR